LVGNFGAVYRVTGYSGQYLLKKQTIDHAVADIGRALALKVAATWTVILGANCLGVTMSP